MRVQEKFHTTGYPEEMNSTEHHRNGVISDGSSPSSQPESRRDSSLAGHSTENLLESDESVDC